MTVLLQDRIGAWNARVHIHGTKNALAPIRASISASTKHPLARRRGLVIEEQAVSCDAECHGECHHPPRVRDDFPRLVANDLTPLAADENSQLALRKSRGVPRPRQATTEPGCRWLLILYSRDAQPGHRPAKKTETLGNARSNLAKRHGRIVKSAGP